MEFKISLAAARVNAELTQKQVCEALHISKTTLTNYEKRRTIPNAKTSGDLAALYGIPSDYIKFF